MTQQIDPRQLTLVGVSFRCRVETHKFLQGKKHDTRYCFELFRRALEEPNSAESTYSRTRTKSRSIFATAL